MKPLAAFLAQRSEAFVFLHPRDLERSLENLFDRGVSLLPTPYKVFFEDEHQPPLIGFPVSESSAMRELEARLERWIGDEIGWHLQRGYQRDKEQVSFHSYVQHVIRMAENALMSTLLADYHGVFWLAHSLHLAKHFGMIPRRISALDAQLGRTQGDAIKYRIFGKWATETRDQLTALAGKMANILDGEEERGLQFFRLLHENVLILTEEFISPDLRELRSFVHGYLGRDFQTFRELLDRLEAFASELARRDVVFRNAANVFGGGSGITLALLNDAEFQGFLFEHPAIGAALNRDEREQVQSMSRRLREFAVLHQLRKSIVWTRDDDDSLPADRKGTRYSRSTRPLDFGRPGVVDPMVHRFGLIYDITAFSETLGDLARSGRKGELTSYRQMLLFQRKLETVTERNRLVFEKFLGDGALYTTRRAINLVRAAIEIQRFYSEMRKKGFAFNRGIRIAINYGYYRLLPMKPRPESPTRTLEFYGPGVVELSRLTTGKATKEIEDLQNFLVARGYAPQTVRDFFAPLAYGADLVDKKMHEREFYAYIDPNGHLINEGIVASMPLLFELSNELGSEAQALVQLKTDWGTYIGVPVGVEGYEYAGIRLLGTISLKGIPNMEIGEIVPFASTMVEASEVSSQESLVTLLRQEYHSRPSAYSTQTAAMDDSDTHETAQRMPVVLFSERQGGGMRVVIGQWDPGQDEIRNLVVVPSEFLSTLGLRIPLSAEDVEAGRSAIENFYTRMLELDAAEEGPIAFRRSDSARTFLLGDKVETL